MSKTKTKVGMLYRRRKRDFAKSVEFPRAVVAASVLLIGFMLLLGALSDASGRLRMLDIGSALYLAAVIGIALLVVYSGRTQDSTKDPRSRSRVGRRPSKPRDGAVGSKAISRRMEARASSRPQQQ